MFEDEEKLVLAARRWAAAQDIMTAPGLRWEAAQALLKAVRSYEKWMKKRPLRRPTQPRKK